LLDNGANPNFYVSQRVFGHAAYQITSYDKDYCQKNPGSSNGHYINSSTALKRSIRKGNKDMVELLLRHGAIIDQDTLSIR